MLKRSIHQDRLGTSLGKVEKKVFSAGLSRRRRGCSRTASPPARQLPNGVCRRGRCGSPGVEWRCSCCRVCGTTVTPHGRRQWRDCKRVRAGAARRNYAVHQRVQRRRLQLGALRLLTCGRGSPRRGDAELALRWARLHAADWLSGGSERRDGRGDCPLCGPASWDAAVGCCRRAGANCWYSLQRLRRCI